MFRKTGRYFVLFMALALILGMMAACGETVVVTSEVDVDVSGEQTENGDSDVSDDISAPESKDPEESGDTSTTAGKGDKKTTTGKDSKKTTTAAKNSAGNLKGAFSGTAEQALAAMPKELRGTELNYFYWWDPKEMTEKDAIKQFTAKTGIKVNSIVCSYSDRMTELAAKITAGNSPDIVRTLTNAMYQVASLQPITCSGYDFSDDCWWQPLMKDYTYNGKCFATNIRPKDAIMIDTFMLFYNKRALRSADLEDPYALWKKDPSKWTWSKLLSMCEAFKQQYATKNDYAGMAMAYNNSYVRMFGCANYDYNSKTGKWESYLDNPELEKRWSEFLNYDAKGLVKINHGGKTSFHRGNYLFYANGPYACRVGDPTHEVLKEANLLGVVPMPVDTPYTLLYEYTGFGIAQGAKNAAAVPYYLRYVYDQSSYDLNKVYINEEAKTVCEYVLDQCEKKYFFGENENYQMWNDIVSGGPDQVKTVLNKYKGVIQAIVDQENEAVASK